MINKFKKLIYENERAFYSILCVCSFVIIQLIYISSYNIEPPIITSLLPLIMWIIYDGNEHEKATTDGYLIWIIILILITIIVTIYPLFPLTTTFTTTLTN